MKEASAIVVPFNTLDPTDTAAVFDGAPWERLLADGEDPERVIDGLARRIEADLKGWTGPTAKILLDHGPRTITLESRAPAPDGVVVFKASITLCVDALTTEPQGLRLSVLPRIVAGTLRWKGGVPWIAHGSEEQFADCLQELQDRLGGISL